MSWQIIDDIDNEEKNNSLSKEENISILFDNDIKKEIVLCVGKVQSGKTQKIFDSIDYAMNKLNYDIVILFGGTNTSLYNQTKERLENNKDESLTYYDKNSIKFAKYVNSRRYVITILKNNDGLDKVISFLYGIKDIKTKKILIVDDESDYASVNISKTSNFSSTFKRISEIYSMIYEGKLLQVTATPFANIVSKKSTELLADRVVCWSNYNEYKGLNEFDEIKEKAYEIIKCEKDNIGTVKKYVNDTINYYLATIINNYERFETERKEISCLFNVDDDIESHLTICNYALNHLSNIKNSKVTFYEQYISKNIDIKLFNERINYIFNNVSVIPFNSLNTNNEIEMKKFNIYAGGIKASRGYTFENLITELIINAPKQKISVDTLLQRCRWFGDRKNIIDLMRIYMNEDIYNALGEAKKYLEILTIGEHQINDLFNKISKLDLSSYYVNSTSKE